MTNEADRVTAGKQGNSAAGMAGARQPRQERTGNPPEPCG